MPTPQHAFESQNTSKGKVTLTTKKAPYLKKIET